MSSDAASVSCALDVMCVVCVGRKGSETLTVLWEMRSGEGKRAATAYMALRVTCDNLITHVATVQSF